MTEKTKPRLPGGPKSVEQDAPPAAPASQITIEDVNVMIASFQRQITQQAGTIAQKDMEIARLQRSFMTLKTAQAEAAK